MRTAIVTDTNSGISVAEGRELGCFVQPMPLLVDGEIRYEGVDLTSDEFYAAHEAFCQVLFGVIDAQSRRKRESAKRKGSALCVFSLRVRAAASS